MNTGFADDFRQSLVVMKNEIKKFTRGKKIILFGALIVLVLALLTILPYTLGNGYDSSYSICVLFMNFLAIILELAAVIFTATSIVSEFEERTALILFTKPVKKSSIFIGKLLASLLMVIGFSLVYLLYVAVFSFIATGGVEMGLISSFGIAICGAFALTGLAMLLSAIFKKGSTASIMTLVMLLLVFDIIILMFALNKLDTWWILTDALNSVIYALGPYVSGSTVITYTNEELIRSGAVLVVWGIVTNIIAYILFKKRDL